MTWARPEWMYGWLHNGLTTTSVSTIGFCGYEDVESCYDVYNEGDVLSITFLKLR